MNAPRLSEFQRRVRPADRSARPGLCRIRLSGDRRAAFVATSWLISVAICCGSEPGVGATPADRIAIRLSTDRTRIEVVGLPDEALAAVRQAGFDEHTWSRVLAVHVAGSNGAATVPLLGAHEVDGSVLVFTPRFPLRPGISYRAVFDPTSIASERTSGLAATEALLTIPQRPAGQPTKVAAVFPSGNELPENLLKFYIHFSASMGRGEAYRHVRLVDSKNRDIPAAFLEIGEELWSPDARRFTLLFDPGRIKRGLRPNEDEGSPLRVGQSYALVIDDAWRDGQGAPLAAEFRKEFRATAPDETQPDPRRWLIETPPAGTREPLVVQFDEPLDSALVEHMITVRDAAHREVDGRIRVDRHETRWRFVPAVAWEPGPLELAIDGTLEDRAGNSIGRPFEVANAGDEVGVTTTTQVVLPLSIEKP